MRRGFTLVELLIVIGIIGILSTVVLLTLNPTELLKQARDSTRIAELASLDKAISFALTQNPDLVLGTANTVYVSLPDNDGTPDCDDYLVFLPTLAPGWQYRCVTQANMRKIDSNGWLPINFTSLSVVPLDTLAVDKSNNAQLGLYYTYAFRGTRWELDAEMESSKYRWGGGGDVESRDGGNTIVLYEKGSGLDSLPKETNWRIGYEVRVPNTAGDCFDVQTSNAVGTQFYTRWAIPLTGISQVAVVKLLYWPGNQAFNSGNFLEMAMYRNSPTPQVKISESIFLEGAGTSNWSSSTFNSPLPITPGDTYIFGFGARDVGSTLYLAYDTPPFCVGYPPTAGTLGGSDNGPPLKDTATMGGVGNHYGIYGIIYSR